MCVRVCAQSLNLDIFAFVPCAFHVISKNSLLIAKTNVKGFFLVLSVRSFTHSGLMFTSLIHFELIFVSGPWTVAC